MEMGNALRNLLPKYKRKLMECPKESREHGNEEKGDV